MAGHGGRTAGFPRLHFGILVAIFLLITADHYAAPIGAQLLGRPSGIPELSRHTLDRILYLFPVIYANYVFGRRGGLALTGAAFVAMMPRAILISTSQPVAVTEAFLVTAVGVAGSLWLNLGKRQQRELRVAVEKVEATQRELRSQITVSTEQQKRLATFTSFSAMLSQSLEVRQAMQTGIHMVMQMMKVPVVLLFLLDQETRELRVTAFEGVSKEFATSIDRLKVGEGFNGRVAEAGQPIVVEDMLIDPRLSRQVVREEGLRGTVIAPLMARGRIIGTLAAAERQARTFDRMEVELLAAVANQIGIAVENSRLYQEQADVVEKLRLSEERYRQLFENAHDAIWVQDLSGRNIAANDAAAQLIGYEAGNEIVGKDVREFIPPESLALARDIRERLVRGDPAEQPYEQKLLRKDGSVAILKMTTSLLTSQGQPAAFQHIARDITMERRLQENLRLYVRQITEAQEEESKRIARELHDSTAQGLIAALHHLESFCRRNPVPCEEDSRFLWSLREELKAILQEIRQFSRDLRPSILDDLGLLPSVEWLVEELKRERQVEATLTVSGPQRRFSPATEVALFRIIQEALRNVTKHSRATRVEVRIEFTEALTIVSISDNGAGFELPRTLSELPRIGKLGLLGMQERAQLIGGSLDIRSGPGEGTTLTITLPAEPL